MFRHINKNKIFYLFLSIFNLFYLNYFFINLEDNPSYYYIIPFIITSALGFISSKNGKLTSFIFILFLLFILAELVTKRMTSFYFHQIPVEIINILYDTNIDEVKNNYHLATWEIAGLILIVLNIIYLIKRGTYSIKKRYITMVLLLLQVATIAVFFYFEENPISKAVKKIENNREVIEKNIISIKEQKKFSWGAKANEDEKQTIVIFLGETHRGDYLSLNGYNKKTTPLLEKEKIISYDNAISQAAYTLQSTPMILSRKDVHDDGIFHEK